MRTAAAATALGLVLVTAGLTSCATPKTGLQPPEPNPSATPVYGSEEEALAAAEELYGRYLRIANKIGQGGWRDTSGYAEVARGDALESELSSAGEFLAKGYRQTGEISFDSMSLQQLSDRGPSHVAITVYLRTNGGPAAPQAVRPGPDHCNNGAAESWTAGVRPRAC